MSITSINCRFIWSNVDLKSALGKKRTDGKHTSLQPLTTIQRLHVSRMVEKYGDDYQVRRMSELLLVYNLLSLFILPDVFHFFWQSMFMDAKLNKMQHSIATLEKLCKRYHMHKDKNPLIVGSSKWFEQRNSLLGLVLWSLPLYLSLFNSSSREIYTLSDFQVFSLYS